jgi:hypothetical protein
LINRPTAGQLKNRYSAFGAVDESTAELFIADAMLFVDDTWREEDQAPGVMSYAAHMMATEGHGVGATSATLQGGVSSVKVGDVSTSYFGGTVSTKDGLNSTSYGRLYLQLRQRNRKGDIAVTFLDRA